ncbi:glycoside hydrolase family 15 protein [Rubrobacter indicoceani]|uniref:glycoside hydrolase family 15 protein n=1 Tax=Rubrobacter indicoceani TaxID=2051957 RepID=UPI000E5C20A9|nr:glycoside hydrolase family 15 protein [Rubrobacter indicoceani]
MAYLPIEDHGVIGDLHTAALVGTDGTIDWLCLPAFDSPSVFCSILDDEKGGHFKLHPSNKSRSQQLYLPETNVLMTRFLSSEGVAEVLDFMPIIHDGDEPHRLVRNVRVVRGEMSLDVECRPAFDYARRPHTVEPCTGGFAFLPEKDRDFKGPEGSDGKPGRPLGLVSQVPLEVMDGGAVGATFTLKEGEAVTFVLSERPEDEPTHLLSEAAFQNLLDRTVHYWRNWVSRCTYTGRWRETVVRSALALKLMVYDPTGALVAAPTMGLPEEVGGERNWDYRYTWLRDAAFTLYALMAIGFEEEAGRFMDWLRDRFQEDEDGLLQPLYGLDGRKEISESELSHLSGYRDSAPVRLGNAAHEQVQLDIYGAVMDAAYLYNKHGEPLDYDLWQNVRRILDWLCDNWQRPDDGIWEVRGGRQQFVSSKVMCWVALERAIRIARQRGLPAGDSRWFRVRDEIYEEIMERGWNEEKQAFVQHYNSEALDASILLMPLVKFVGPTDPRWKSTLKAIQKELAHDTLVDRYRIGEAATDGLDGDEGSFSICSFWLVECLTRAGDVEDARLAFDKMLSYSNHLGLYAEEIGSSGEHLGNFPQAFTHLSLISAAIHLDRALGSR